MCWQSADYVHEGSPVTSAAGNRAAVSFSVRGLGPADGTYVPDSSTIGCRAPGRVAGRLPSSSSVSETLDYLDVVLRSSLTMVGRRYRKPRAGAMHMARSPSSGFCGSSVAVENAGQSAGK